MENDVIISVIVPVYNAEKFIRRAADSVVCQMDGRIELILVDDGSTDTSGAICDEYASNHDLISVVHKPNGGLSSARNAGMAVAAGSYIVFLDADDYLEPNTITEIEKVISNYWPDYIDYGFKYISSSNEIIDNMHKLPKNVLLGKDVIINKVLPPLLNLCNDDDCFIFPFAWNKVYRKSVIEGNKIAFDERRRTWEDRLFVACYLKYCENFYSMDLCLYNYVDIACSLSRQYSMDYFDIILENFRKYTQLYGDVYDFDSEYVNNYWAQSIENMIYLSLDQKVNNESIYSNILSTLQTEQVIQWFAKRKPNNIFECKVGELIVSGNAKRAVCCYKIQAAKKARQQATNNFFACVRRVIRKMVRG